MADPRKASNSSMIDLKAELFRKQEEYKQLKAQNSSDFVKGVKTSKPGSKGEKIWSKKNAGVLQRASRDLAEKEEEDNVMERSRKALEAKSKIYEKIASESGIPDEDGSEGYLVDFQRKAVDRIVEQRRGEGRTGTSLTAGTGSGDRANHDASDDDMSSDEPVPLPANPGEEWVDYVDTFGRSRRCLRKDLPHLEKQERPLGRPPGDAGLKLKEGATLLSADMKRELRRQQWEKEAEESANGPVHYANVQFDEIRTHGTAFYQFSKDSNLREEQMEMLNKLREQTMDGRQRSERIKEKRKAALEARLAKVKQRRKMKDGSVLGGDDKEEEQTAVEDPAPAAAAQEAEPLTRDDSWRRSAPVREWDIGKEKLPEWNAKRYMEQKRSERESEFAPPQFYFDQPPRNRGISPQNTSSQNGDRYVRSTQPPPSTSGSTEAMLKQIRQSLGASPNSHASLGEERKHSHMDSKADIDLGSIPMPPAGGVAEKVHSSLSVKAEQGLQAGMATGEGSVSGEVGVGQQTQSARFDPNHVQTPLLPQAGYGQLQMGAFTDPFPDTSMPPPGYPVQPQVLPEQAGAAPIPQSAPSAFASPPSVPGEQDHSFAKPFVYPSQQGLLTSQPRPQVTPVVAQRPAPKPAPAKVSVPKLSMVDKRFMQNREVSEEDLLGYMAHTSADPLTKIQAVSYTPGHFSSAASSQGRDPAPSESDAGKEATAATSESARPAAQTEGVIFGVPDFLQPAAMTATTYQPGSFMAAKEAAAQRAEEEYEAARKKTQYSSAPVLYSRPDDDEVCEQGGTQDSKKEKNISSVDPQRDETDEEYTKFMREVRGGK